MKAKDESKITIEMTQQQALALRKFLGATHAAGWSKMEKMLPTYADAANDLWNALTTVVRDE